MSNRIPTRKERLRRAYKSAERTKNQWDNANDVYKDVRDVITREDPKMDDDFIWPEAIERWSAETINLEEEAKAWEKEVKRLKEINMRYDQEIERLGVEIQSSQLTDDEPDNITQHRKLHIPEYSTTNLATLSTQYTNNERNSVFDGIVIKISPLTPLEEDVQLWRGHIRDRRQEYDDLKAKHRAKGEQLRSAQEQVFSLEEGLRAETEAVVVVKETAEQEKDSLQHPRWKRDYRSPKTVESHCH